jgi:Cu-Zn family superoxide dismutase
MKTVRFLVVIAAMSVACSPPPSPPPAAPAPAAPVVRPPPPRPLPTATAAAIIRDPSGKQVGSITLADTYAGLLIIGSVGDLGLGAHAIHIHAIGKCEAPFTTAGAHFNPTNRQHGYRSPTGPHLGDLPNLDLPAAGREKFEILLPNVTLKGEHALLDADGASVVIHAERDDYTADPSGNSGGRIACGVIVPK